MDITLLKKIGLSDKTIRIYFHLITQGPASIRTLAKETGMNRGTVYDTLNSLKEKGLVNFYREEKKQWFVAENPKRILNLMQESMSQLEDTHLMLKKNIPELQALYDAGTQRPISKYYEGRSGIAAILKDVLEQAGSGAAKEYQIYSAAPLREYLYEALPNFTAERIQRGIHVRAIAMGKGGVLQGLDERRWLKKTNGQEQTYIFIYPGKTAYISLTNRKKLVGVVIENEGIASTQKMIFEELWGTIPT